MLYGYFAKKQGVMAKTYILNAQQAAFKIQRMALEIVERNSEIDALILAGIAPNGTIIANQLKQLIEKHYKNGIEIQEVTLSKKCPSEVIVHPVINLDGKVVVVIDDVANSGKTLTYALKPFLLQHPISIQTLVLVARTHRLFPIQPDYIGLSLASTIQDYIDVEVVEGKIVGTWME